MIHFSVPGDRIVKIKESKKREKFLEFAKELKQNKNYGT